MRNARMILGLCLLVAGAVLLLSPAGAALGSFARTAVDDPLKPTPGPGDPSPDIPTLTEAEQQDALSILQSDPRARAFLASRQFSVEAVGPWTTYSQEKIGAALVLKLNRPGSYPFLDWPTPVDENTPAAYHTKFVRASAKGVTTLLVQIDLTSRRIAGLRPGPGASLTPAPGVTASTAIGD
jgi:hypothetical protein